VDHAALRKIAHANQDPGAVPHFPAEWDAPKRDVFYRSLSRRGWGGASGDDSCIIAYDALLVRSVWYVNIVLWLQGAGASWTELLKRGALHSGDSDSTGCIACAWWGAIYGFRGVCEGHYANLEVSAMWPSTEFSLFLGEQYKERLRECADGLFVAAQQAASDAGC